MNGLQKLKQIARGFMYRNVPFMVTCAEFEEFIFNYDEGTLPPKQKRIFDIHMMFCKDCRSYLAAYRRTIEMSKAAFKYPDDPLPEDVPEDLVRAIMDARSTEN